MHFSETAALLSLAIVVVACNDFYQRCTITFCGNFSYFDIPKLYGGLFKTREQIEWENGKWAMEHQRRYDSSVMSFYETIFDSSSDSSSDSSFDSSQNLLYDSSHDYSGDNSNPGNHDFDQCCPT